MDYKFVSRLFGAKKGQIAGVASNPMAGRINMKGIKYYLNNKYEEIEMKACNSSLHSSKSHLHEEVSIGLIKNGNCNLEVCDRSYFIKEKSILVIPPEIVHKCNPINLDNWNFKMIYINGEWIKKNFGISCEEIKFKYKELDSQNFEKIDRIFAKLEKIGENIEDEVNLFEFISNLILDSEKEYNLIQSSNYSKTKIKNIKEYISKNYLTNIKLDDLAEFSKLSKYYVIREYEKMYGISPHKYINSLKISYAKKYMKTDKNIANTALESGFYDQSHFNKIFKEYTGITPLKYLKDIM